MNRGARPFSLEHIAGTRRSIRHFDPNPIPRDVIADVLRIALCAPSPHNVQPWRFTGLFAAPDKSRLAHAMASRLEHDLVRDGIEAEVIGATVARSVWRVTTAPVVLVCSLVPDGLVHFEDERRRVLEWQMAVQSLGAVLQTLFLAAWERHIGSCWMAAPMYCPDEVRVTLSLPDSYEPQALALLGYASVPGKARERRSFDGVVDLR